LPKARGAGASILSMWNGVRLPEVAHSRPDFGVADAAGFRERAESGTIERFALTPAEPALSKSTFAFAARFG
jgi:hypothetical protein